VKEGWLAMSLSVQRNCSDPFSFFGVDDDVDVDVAQEIS